MLRVLLSVALTAACTATALAAAEPSPTLRVVGRTPLTIEGRGFDAGRSVTLIVRAPGVSERRAPRTSRLGRFRVVVPAVSLTGLLRCGVRVVITARVGNGDLVLWHPALPDCPSPLRPPA